MSTTTSQKDVLRLITDGASTDVVVRALGELSAGARRSLARPIAELAETLTRSQFKERTAAHDVIGLAVLGTAGGARAVKKALAYLAVPVTHEDAAVQVLRDRMPPWLPELPDALLRRRSAYAPSHVRLVRAIVRDGLAPAPRSAVYATELAMYFRGKSALSAMRADPAFGDDDLWFMLTAEPAGRLLNYHYKYSHPDRRNPEGWPGALITLAAEGVIDRDRMIDTLLGILVSDWAPADSAFALALHDEMAITRLERLSRQSSYARLLSSPVGPIVALGLRFLSTSLNEGNLDIDVALSAMPPVLQRQDKVSVVAALAFLADIGGRHADRAGQIADLLQTVGEHPRADVRDRARKLRMTLDPGAVDDGGAEPEPEPVPAPIVRAPRRLGPLESVDDLADTLLRLGASATPSSAVEQALDGVVRFAGERPRQDDQAPEGNWPPHFSIRSHVRTLKSAWLSRSGLAISRSRYGFLDLRFVRSRSGQPSIDPTITLAGTSLRDWTAWRFFEAAALGAAGGSQGLLSLPTAVDGSLEAAELVRRVGQISPSRTPAPFDAALALLRVPPEDRNQLQFPVGHRVGEHLTAQLIHLDAYRPVWQMQRWQDDLDSSWPLHYTSDRGDIAPIGWRDTAPPTGATGPLQPLLDRSTPMASNWAESKADFSTQEFDTQVATWALMFPHHPDLLASHAHARLVTALRANGAHGGAGAAPLFDALATTRTPFGAPALSALVLGLAAREVDTRTRAVDALVETAEAGRLNGTALGTAAKTLIPTTLIPNNRVADSLRTAASAGPAAAEAVVDCLTALLGALPGMRDAARYVELLADLAIARRRKIPLPAGLLEVPRNNALGRACRRVPQD